MLYYIPIVLPYIVTTQVLPYMVAPLPFPNMAYHVVRVHNMRSQQDQCSQAHDVRRAGDIHGGCNPQRPLAI